MAYQHHTHPEWTMAQRVEYRLQQAGVGPSCIEVAIEWHATDPNPISPRTAAVRALMFSGIGVDPEIRRVERQPMYDRV